MSLQAPFRFARLCPKLSGVRQAQKDCKTAFRADAHCMRAATRRRRRAYTLIEVVGATVLFVLTVSLLAGTTASVISSRMAMRRSAQIDAVLDRLLDQVATNSFPKLLANNFDPPSRCPGDAESSGSLGRSCVVIGSSAVTVSWAVAAGADSANPSGPLDAADDVTLTATAVRPDGSTFVRTRTVAAPYPAYRPGYASVRVLLGGDFQLLDSPVFLLSGTGFTTVQDAQRPSASGALVLRAPASACTSTSPCRLGLSTGTRRGMTSRFTLDAASVTGSTSLIVLDASRVSDVRASVRRLSPIVLTIDAPATQGGRHVGGPDSLPEAGSVCVWFSFNDGVKAQRVPGCNFDGSSIRFSSYSPDDSGVLVGAPSMTDITLQADAPNLSSCPVIPGQRYFTGSAWATVSTVGVCSSWTWGRPSRLVIPGDSSSPYSIPATITATPGSPFVGIVEWDSGADSTAAPASGWGYQPTFSDPRNASACPSWPTACQPSWITGGSTQAPEATTCPGAFCYGSQNAAPALIQVAYGASFQTTATWPYAVVAASSASTQFRTYFEDNENQAVSVTVLSSPSTGTLKFCTSSCSTVSDGTLVAPALTTTSSLSANSYVTWQFDASATANATPSFTIRVSDGTAYRDEVVLLPPTAQAVVAQPLATTVAQSGVSTVYARVYNSSGALASGTVTWGTPATGATTSAPQAATASGIATVALAGGTAQASTGLSLTARIGTWPSTRMASLSYQVTPQPGSIVFSSQSGTTVQQSKSVTPTLTIRVKDAAGAALPFEPVSLRTYNGSGAAWRGVYFSPGACLTDQTGSCALPTIAASSAAVAQSGTMQASTGTAAVSSPLSVTQLAARVLATSASVPQGSEAVFNLLVTDDALAPVASQSITLQGASGVSISKTAVTTGPTGLAAITATAAASAPSGKVLINATLVRVGSSDLVVPLSVQVVPVATSVSLSAPSVSVTRGQTSYVTVRASDSQGTPVPGAYETASCTASGVAISSGVSTVSDGTALLSIYAPTTNAAGSTTCSIVVAGLSPLTLTVTVT